MSPPEGNPVAVWREVPVPVPPNAAYLARFVRVPERWRLIKLITEFENRQIAAVKNEVD